jgi:hypothetical protein
VSRVVSCQRIFDLLHYYHIAGFARRAGGDGTAGRLCCPLRIELYHNITQNKTKKCEAVKFVSFVPNIFYFSRCPAGKIANL